MQNEKCSNKTLRICGTGSVRKNGGVWQAVVTVADDVTGRKSQRTKNTGIACAKTGTRGRTAALRALSQFRTELDLELIASEEARASPRGRRNPPRSGTTTPRCRSPRRSRSSSPSAWR